MGKGRWGEWQRTLGLAPQTLKGRGSLPPSLHFASKAETRKPVMDMKDKARPKPDRGLLCSQRAWSLSRQVLSPQLSLILHQECPSREPWGHVALRFASARASPSPVWGGSVQALVWWAEGPAGLHQDASHLWLSPGQPRCSHRLRRALSHRDELQSWEMRQGPGCGARRTWHGLRRALLLDGFSRDEIKAAD